MTDLRENGRCREPERLRRILLRTLVGAAIVGPSLCRTAGAAIRTVLSEDEVKARDIGYASDAGKLDVRLQPTYKRGQSCATCALIEFGTARQRGCQILPGRLVNAGGWCKLWKTRST